MSGELDKLANRLKELNGKPFKKITDKRLELEREAEIIREEIAEETKAKSNALVIQRLESRLVGTLRALNELKE